MPTAKPRITITLSEHQHEVLASLSKLQKVSMSAIIVDFLDSTMPVLERLAGILQTASTAPQAVRDQLRQSAEQAENDFGQIPVEIQGQLDFMLQAAREAAALPSDAVSRDAATDRPPTSNRGVRIPNPRSGRTAKTVPTKSKKGAAK